VLISFLHPSQPVSVAPQVHSQPSPPARYPVYPQQPVYQQPEPRIIQTVESYSEEELEAPNPLDIDWTTWGLGLFALVAVGGLIPFLLWVYFTYRPPIP
jgi:hypothetical protein